MIINVVFNTKYKIDYSKLYNKVQEQFEEAVLACPYLNINIEGNPPIRDEHRLACSLNYSDLIIFVSTIYSDATPLNRLIRSIELRDSTKVYNWMAKEFTSK